jgi:hypothetical protein
MPIPTWKPLRTPSLLLATSGTPKFTSTLTGSKRYIRPTPADIEGFVRHPIKFSLNPFAVIGEEQEYNQYNSRGARIGYYALLSIASNLPAFTKMCDLMGQCGFLGISDTKETPVDQ